jgi:hypothetical protein
MANSEVVRVELKEDGSTNLYLEVWGYDAGTPVEISGTIIQASGTAGSFYEVQQIPSHGRDVGVILMVTVPTRLVTGEPVTAVVRVADA